VSPFELKSGFIKYYLKIKRHFRRVESNSFESPQGNYLGDVAIGNSDGTALSELCCQLDVEIGVKN
jgi:hypothetical protein